MQSLSRSGAVAQRPFSAARTSRCVLVAAKPSKAADYRALSPEELVKGVAGLKAEYTRLQYLKKSNGRVINPDTMQEQNKEEAGEAPKSNEFKHVRRQIAQMMTVLREKQIADGIDRRTSRKLEKAASVGAGMGGR